MCVCNRVWCAVCCSACPPPSPPQLTQPTHLSYITACLLNALAPDAVRDMVCHLAFGNRGVSLRLVQKLARVVGPVPQQPYHYLRNQYAPIMLAFVTIPDGLEAVRANDLLSALVRNVVKCYRASFGHQQPRNQDETLLAMELLKYHVVTLSLMFRAGEESKFAKDWMQTQRNDARSQLNRLWQQLGQCVEHMPSMQLQMRLHSIDRNNTENNELCTFVELASAAATLWGADDVVLARLQEVIQEPSWPAYGAHNVQQVSQQHARPHQPSRLRTAQNVQHRTPRYDAAVVDDDDDEDDDDEDDDDDDDDDDVDADADADAADAANAADVDDNTNDADVDDDDDDDDDDDNTAVPRHDGDDGDAASTTADDGGNLSETH